MLPNPVSKSLLHLQIQREELSRRFFRGYKDKLKTELGYNQKDRPGIFN